MVLVTVRRWQGCILPRPDVVQEYADSVPGNFKFCIKVPNSITLTHHYKKKQSDPRVLHQFFLSSELMLRFLELLQPLSNKTGPLVFQFEYLNKLKIPGGFPQFEEIFGRFLESLPTGFHYSMEKRNSNYLNRGYFSFAEKIGLHHIFLQG